MDKRKRSGLEITSIGSLYHGPWEKKYWSSSRGKDRYPYPVGYCAVRCHNDNSYKMEIQEGSRGPIFVVTFGDGVICSADTPTIAWQNVMKKEGSNSKKPPRRLVSSNVDGPELFGFLNPLVQRLFRELVSAEEKAHPSNEPLESSEGECYRGNTNKQTLSANDESNKSLLWESVKTLPVRKSSTSIASARNTEYGVEKTSSLLKCKDLTHKSNGSGRSNQMQNDRKRLKLTKPSNKTIEETHHIGHEVVAPDSSDDESDPEMEDDTMMLSLKKAYKNRYSLEVHSTNNCHDQSNTEPDNRFVDKPIPLILKLSDVGGKPSEAPVVRRETVTTNIVEKLSSSEPANLPNLDSIKSQDCLEVLTSANKDLRPDIELRECSIHKTPPVIEKLHDLENNIKVSEVSEHQQEAESLSNHNEGHEPIDSSVYRHPYNTKDLAIIVPDSFDDFSSQIRIEPMQGMENCWGQKSKIVTKDVLLPTTEVPDSLEDIQSQLYITGDEEALSTSTTRKKIVDPVTEQDHVDEDSVVPDSYDTENAVLCSEDASKPETDNMVVEETVGSEERQTNSVDSQSEFLSAENSQWDEKNMDKVESDSLGQELTKSMITLLLPQALDLLDNKGHVQYKRRNTIKEKKKTLEEGAKDCSFFKPAFLLSTSSISELKSEQLPTSLGDKRTIVSGSIQNQRGPSVEADQKCLPIDVNVDNQEDIDKAAVLGKPNIISEILLGDIRIEKENLAVHATGSLELEKDLDKKNCDVLVGLEGMVNMENDMTIKPTKDVCASDSEYKLDEQYNYELDSEFHLEEVALHGLKLKSPHKRDCEPSDSMRGDKISVCINQFVAEGDVEVDNKLNGMQKVTAIDDRLIDLPGFNYKQSNHERDVNDSIETVEGEPLNILQSDVFEPKACLEHPMPVLVLKVHFQEDKIRFVVLCGTPNSTLRVLYAYEASNTGFNLTLLSSIDMEVSNCACHIAHLEFEKWCVQFTPDGCHLVLLDMFKPRNTVAEPTNQQVNCCLGVKLLSYTNGDFSIHTTLMSPGKHVLSFLVSEPYVVISGGENGYVCCWIMDSNWRICLENFTLPVPVNEEDKLTHIIQLLAVPSWPVLLVGCDDQSSIAIWNFSARQLLRISKLSGVLPQEVHFLNILSHDTTEQITNSSSSESWEAEISNSTFIFLVGSGQHMTLQNISKSWILVVLRRDGNLSTFDLDNLLERVSAMSIMEGMGVAGTADGLLHLWDTVSGLVFETHTELQGAGITHIASNWAGNILAVADSDARVLIYMKE